AGADQRQRLLPAAPEYERVAALEPQDATALPGVGNEQIVDVALPRGRASAPLAGVDDARTIARQIENTTIDQCVVDDDVGATEPVRGKEGQEARIAGAGSRQPYLAGREGRESRKAWRQRDHGRFVLVFSASRRAWLCPRRNRNSRVPSVRCGEAGR